jgi:surfeit locus 1 family protein
MRWREWTWRPQLGLTLVTLGLVLLFVRLGFWQLSRAEQKAALRETMTASSYLPLAIEEMLSPDPDKRLYKVIVQGTYEPDHSIFLIRPQAGKFGYQIVTPMQIQNTDIRVLVNRGWVAGGASLKELPRVTTPNGELTVHGWLDYPVKPSYGAKLPDSPQERLWTYIDLDYYKSGQNHPLQPFVILQDPEDAGGYLRLWPQLELHPERNTGYALQWFAFALIGIIAYICLSLHRDPVG